MKKYKVFTTILIILILLVLTALGLYIFKKDTVKSWLNLKDTNGVTQEPKVEEPGKEEAPTKIDKISKNELTKNINEIKKTLNITNDNELIKVSSVTKQGIEEVHTILEQYIKG